MQIFMKGDLYMIGLVSQCPDKKCESELIVEKDGVYRCYSCRKVFFKPYFKKKSFKNVSLFGVDDESD